MSATELGGAGEQIAPETNATEHMVRMRDGVRLATDMYLPEGWTTGPAVLVRLPYGKRDRYPFMPFLAPVFNERGYAFVVQDVRGKHRSEGQTLQAVHEVYDGYDTLEWLSHAGWSNGVVGMFGDSYYGFTQWAALASRHPALRAIVPRMCAVELPNGGPDGVASAAGPGGSTGGQGLASPPSVGWARFLAGYWLDKGVHAAEYDPAVRPPLAGFNELFERLGKRSASFDLLIPEAIPVSVLPTGHPFEARPIPVLHQIGWFDPVAKRGMKVYLAADDRPAWSPLQYLHADVTDHENYHLDQVPVSAEDDHDYKDDALRRMLPRYLGPALEFFDHFLQGRPRESPIAKVRWHLAHAGPREADRWPPAGAAPLTLHLTGLTGAGNSSRGGLSNAPTEDDERVSWVHDPDDLVPSAIEALSILREYPDERPVEQRDDVLVFTSEAFDAPLDLAGPVTVRLHIASTAGSTDLFVKLLDVAPDGAAHRVLADQVTVLDASGGGAIEWTVGHTGYRVLPGHRLRLHVASSEGPDYLPHPGVPGNRWLVSETRKSTQTLTSSADRPSWVVVTTLPRS